MRGVSTLPTQDASAAYWQGYGSLQHHKHKILASYLGAWFAILGNRNRTLVYLDSHAGRGRHESGEPGSPLVALNQALEHLKAGRLSGRSIHLVFLEVDAGNASELERQIDESCPDMPPEVRCHVVTADYEERLTSLLDSVANRQQVPPLFAFIDPFGFSLPLSLLNRVLALPRSEILITFMVHYVNLAICQGEQHGRTLDGLFGRPDWRHIASLESHERRNQEIVELFAQGLDAEYTSKLRTLGKDNRTKYFLVHATNHHLGRTKFKEAIWRAGLGESWTISERTSPLQLPLGSDPDLESLRESLLENFAGRTVSYRTLCHWLLATSFLEKHLRSVLKCLERAAAIVVDRPPGRRGFNEKMNPTLTFPPQKR